MNKKITVVGLGYIGLPTAAVMAKKGLNVLGYDINKRVVESLNKGKIIIEEPGLDELVKEVVESGKLRGINNFEKSDVFIISVPTPIKADKTADISYVEMAVEAIVPFLEKGNIVVLESTSPPGTTEDVVVSILEKSGLIVGEELFVAHSPERVLPGKIIQELVENDRIIGGINEKSTQLVKEIYEVFVEGEIFTTDSKTAEMTKLMENTFRDVNIALANELAILSENMGINAWEVIKFANKHPRVNLHQPGPGVGGHCIAVDPWFVIEGQPEAKLIRQAREINDNTPNRVMKKIESLMDSTQGKITILGVTYKPNVDDTRESPIIKLIDKLREDTKFELAVHDPHAKRDIFKYKDILVDDLEEAVKNSELIVLGVNHLEYKDLDFESLGRLMKNRVVYDTRNFLNEKELIENGFRVNIIGRG
ncbi:MAG: nucleotide sugar dehydrogenase [Gudongella sp.]|nr:nucleotide sugar dehydrogenase [Gudongella sp.]